MSGAGIGRDEEMRELRSMANDEGRGIGLVCGRRRVGKTHLLTEAWREQTNVFYYAASPTSPTYNRRALLREACNWAGVELREKHHPDWGSVFESLFELRSDESVVLAIDDVQHVAGGDETLEQFAVQLRDAWEEGSFRESDLCLVLSARSGEPVEALESGAPQLFGRLDSRRRLEPFDYLDAGRMVSYGLRDKVRTYAAFGGLPSYLNAVDGGGSVEENILELAMSPDGPVRLQIEGSLDAEPRLRDSDKYRAILASVGAGRRTVAEVGAGMGRGVDSGLKRMLQRLVELGYLEEERNFDAPRNQPIRFRIADPASRFYYGLVLPNASAIACRGAESVWRERLEPEVWPRYVGSAVFGDITRQAYLRQAEELNLPRVDEWGRWEGTDESGREIEVDVVARLIDRRMMTGCVRFRPGEAGAKAFLDHVHALERLADSGYDWAKEALEPGAVFLFISAGGFDDSFESVREEYPDNPVVTGELDDLYGADD